MLSHNDDEEGIRIISFDRIYQQQVLDLFAHGLTSYKSVTPCGGASQKLFAKAKMSKEGDMFDIFESYMSTDAEKNHSDTVANGICKHFWVAVNEENKVLGCVGIIMSTYDSDETAIYESSSDTADTGINKLNVCELVRMSVSEDARGKGLGSRLCRVFEAYATGKGMKRIVLSTLEDMHLAVGLYVKCGYRLLLKTNVDPEFYKHVAEEENFELEDVVVVHYGKDL